MMIEKQRAFDRNSPLFECMMSVLIVFDFLSFPYTSRYFPASWNNIKSPLLLHRQS